MGYSTSEKEFFKKLNKATDRHSAAMTNISAGLVKLGTASEETLLATKEALAASQELSLLLLVLLGNQPEA